MHTVSRVGRTLVGLSNARNRPKIDGIDDIYRDIFGTIVDQRLPPGTKLNELILCEIFNASRRQIGEVLRRLAHDGLVAIHRNRGAFVAAPNADEARAIFDARKIIEAEIVRIVAAQATRDKLQPLRHNVEAEAEFRHAGRHGCAKPSACRANSIFCSAPRPAIRFSMPSCGNWWRAPRWWWRSTKTRIQ